jgi:hypothetical protein
MFVLLADGVIDFNALCGAFPAGSIVCDPNITLAAIVSKGLNYAFAIAGLFLLVKIVSSGFQMMIGAANPKTKENASKDLSNAVLGFIIVFTSYWLVTIVKKILGME